MLLKAAPNHHPTQGLFSLAPRVKSLVLQPMAMCSFLAFVCGITHIRMKSLMLKFDPSQITFIHHVCPQKKFGVRAMSCEATLFEQQP